jgi:SAM-dependent methyltransferase
MSGEPDPRLRFSATASRYREHRPSYPPALYRWLGYTSGALPGSPAIDLACGTGISSRPLAAAGFAVIGVDPNPEMLAQATRESSGDGSGPRYLRGEAEATGLPTASAELVTVAQAFHWFWGPAARAEIRRVLIPGGWCAAYWNIRDRSPLMDDYQELLNTLPEYTRLVQHQTVIDQIDREPELCDRVALSLPNQQEHDREGFLGRVFSSSYVAHHAGDRAELERAVGAMFDRHQQHGRVRFEYRTVARLFRLR